MSVTGVSRSGKIPRAVWQGRVLAESEEVELGEGNVCFPPDSVNDEFFEDSEQHTVCGWKGTASYLTAVANGQKARNAGWYYPDPSRAARKIKGYVAFYSEVTVEG